MNTSDNSDELGMVLDSLPLPSISASAVLAELSIGSYNPQRKDHRVTDTVNTVEGASSDTGQYTKRLFPGIKLFTQVKTLEMRARAVHRELTMPWSDNGQRILVTPIIPEYVFGISAVRNDFWATVLDIQNNYDAIMLEVQHKMGALFDPSLYPSRLDIVKQFKFHEARVPVPETNDFDRIAGSAQAVMREEFERHLRHVREGIVVEMTTNTRKVLEKMSERLDYEGGDDKKGFKNTLVTNVSDWHDKLGKFNEVVKLPEMEKMHRQIGDVLDNITPEVLRVSSEVRGDVKRKVDSILKTLDW